MLVFSDKHQPVHHLFSMHVSFNNFGVQIPFTFKLQIFQQKPNYRTT